MVSYVHDEWCDLDSTGHCDCVVSLLKAKDKVIAEYEERFEVQRAHIVRLQLIEAHVGAFINNPLLIEKLMEKLGYVEEEEYQQKR